MPEPAPVIRRIRKELKQLWMDPPAFCRPGATPVTDLFHWDRPPRQPLRRRHVPRRRRLPQGLPLQAHQAHLQNQGESALASSCMLPPNKIARSIGICLTARVHAKRYPDVRVSALRVYHPNIGPEGKMALDIFGRGWWPNLTIRTVLLSVVSVLYDPVRHDAARLYKRERGLYDEKARRWTRRYASAPVVSFYPAGMELFEELLDEAAISGAVARRRSCGAGKWRFFGGRLLGAI
ncbi:Ubiquitin-conjugating enzyme E2-17 kDa [Triticum urartu]|uniref:Ubiquitin-conjugating enzyme E2-17 kDa n=1 Tax=Triticum urartu TaxID=4572 RepID=M7ZNY0_TRIUA|nr:ubiquitin-conjugating enzyme E2-17 kDa-like [Triticum urartu]EMS49784.1 Ubiquitin-conjugating enzyme E2-17 kDa [Triticum urartu]